VCGGSAGWGRVTSTWGLSGAGTRVTSAWGLSGAGTRVTSVWGLSGAGVHSAIGLRDMCHECVGAQRDRGMHSHGAQQGRDTSRVCGGSAGAGTRVTSVSGLSGAGVHSATGLRDTCHECVGAQRGGGTQHYGAQGHVS